MHVDPTDGFYPIAATWMFDFFGSSAYDLSSDELIRSPQQDYTCVGQEGWFCAQAAALPLSPSRGAGQILDYPTKVTDRSAEQKLEYNTIEGADGVTPDQDPVVYYYRVDTSNGVPGGKFVIQYWYYYTYNYFESGILTSLFGAETAVEHEGGLGARRHHVRLERPPDLRVHVRALKRLPMLPRAGRTKLRSAPTESMPRRSRGPTRTSTSTRRTATARTIRPAAPMRCRESSVWRVCSSTTPRAKAARVLNTHTAATATCSRASKISPIQHKPTNGPVGKEKRARSSSPEERLP